MLLTLLKLVGVLLLGGVGVILIVLGTEITRIPGNERERRRNLDHYHVKEQLYFKERLWEEVERVEYKKWER